MTSGLLSSAIVLRPDSTPGLTQIVVIVHTTGPTHKNLVPSEDLSSARNVSGVRSTTGDHSTRLAPACHPLVNHKSVESTVTLCNVTDSTALESPKQNPNFVNNSLSLIETPDRNQTRSQKKLNTTIELRLTPSLHHYNTFTELLQLREPDDWRRLRSGRYHSSSDLELATLATPQRDNRTRTPSVTPGRCWRQH